ncbi:uncharacterized protein [Triticum aestivum]|uniref:uncharacterized protein n=1 Tax=Triticum aestivum TaxID=4565 RepID=UPI001D012112|nr:uncharacterized protein LOC123039385 [Triticum aestivum]
MGGMPLVRTFLALLSYLIASMGLQALWSLGLACLDGYVLQVKRDLNNAVLVSLFVVRDWVTHPRGAEGGTHLVGHQGPALLLFLDHISQPPAMADLQTPLVQPKRKKVLVDYLLRRTRRIRHPNPGTLRREALLLAPLLASVICAAVPFAGAAARSALRRSHRISLFLQARGCSSYPFSFPSQPPDIRNWFSSYQYESPEVPELAVDPPAVHNGSETQDPSEYRVAEHSFLKHAPRDGGTDLKGGCLGSQAQAEPAEVSARRDILPIGRSTVEQGTKRKQSLRGLFGAGFLDDHEEATQTEGRVVSPVQRSAVDPPWNRNWVGLQNRKRSHEGMVEYSEPPTDGESTCIAETQAESRVALPVLRSAVDPPWNCNWIGLSNGKRIHEGVVEHSELLTDSEGTCIAETQENPRGGQEIYHRKQPFNCGGTSLADIEEGFIEDSIEPSNLPVNSHSKGLTDAEKTEQTLPGLFEAGFLDNHDEATQTESRVVLPVLRSAVDPPWDCNWIGLRNRKRSHEGAVDDNELLTDSESTCIAETQVKPPGGQETNHTKRPVNCGGTSLAADTEEGFLEDGNEHCNLPVDSHSKGLADAEKTKQSLRGLFEAGFLDNGDEATQTESRVVSPVLRSAVDPCWNRNWIGLRNRKRSHEGAVEHSELLTNSDSTCIAETQVNPPGDQQTNHSKHPVNCGGTSLAADTGLEDGIEHSNLPDNFPSKGLAGSEKPKRSLRKFFGASFLDDCDEANEYETRVVSAVQRNAVQPLSNCNAAGLPHIEHIREGTVGYSEPPADHEGISIAETRENPQAGRVC